MESNSTLKWTGYFAVAAALIYVGATAGGSLLDPSYSQVNQHVSDLTATGAPTKDELSPFYLLYNVLVALFAFGLYRLSERGRLFQLGSWLLAVNALAGMLMVTLFTEDLGGAPSTFNGNAHVAVAAISSVAILAASVVYGFAFRQSAIWRGLSTFSFVISACFLVAAPLAIVATAASTYAGLAERAAIAPFIVWLLVVGGNALLQHRRSAELQPTAPPRTALTNR